MKMLLSAHLRRLADRAWERGNKELSTELHRRAREQEAKEKEEK